MKKLLPVATILSSVSCTAGLPGSRAQISDTGESAASFVYTYQNHQWNGFKISLADSVITVDTPQGDDANPQRNVSWGFRPFLVFNRFAVTGASENVEHALWTDEEGSPERGDVYCKRVSSLYDTSETTFPKTTSDLFEAFGIPLENRDAACDITIEKPGTAPSWQEGSTVPLGDEVCLFSPRALTGKGPRLVTIYAPFRYSEKPLGPYLHEWPQARIQVCVDGRKSTAHDANPPDTNPTPAPTQAPIPDLLTTAGSESSLVELARDIQNLKGVKYLFDRKDDVVYLQNTRRYEYHLPFILEHVARFGGRLSAAEYERLLFAPSPKEITGGELFWAANGQFPGVAAKGVLGFSVYCRDRPDVAEIRTTLDKLRLTVPFAADRTMFVFENTSDFMRHRNELQSAGVVSRPLQSLVPR